MRYVLARSLDGLPGGTEVKPRKLKNFDVLLRNGYIAEIGDEIGRCRVIRAFDEYRVGQLVDCQDWPRARMLIEQRYLVPAPVKERRSNEHAK